MSWSNKYKLRKIKSIGVYFGLERQGSEVVFLVCCDSIVCGIILVDSDP
jgi:hypothetical protein